MDYNWSAQYNHFESSNEVNRRRIDWKMVSKRIYCQRKKLNMTREEVAKKIGRAPKYYSDIERGACGMSIETLVELSNVLNLSVDYILYGIDEKIDLYEKICRTLKKYDIGVQSRAVNLMNFYLEQEGG